MPAFLLLVVVAGLVVVHIFAPFRASAAVLILSTFIIPAGLQVPYSAGDVYVLRVGLAAAVLGILARVGRGEIDRSAIRWSRVLLALGLFVVVAYVIGVATAPYPADARRGLSQWLLLLDQMAFLWVATVAVRVLGVRWVAGCAAIGALTVTGIGIAEHFTKTSYARWWYHDQLTTGLVPANPLQPRGAKLRSRATADFALQYGWVLMYFFPMVFVLAIRKRPILGLAAPFLMVVALYFSITRSAYAGLGAGALALVIFARGDRRVLAPIFAGAVVVGFLYFATTGVRDPYAAANPDSVESRERRIEKISDELSTRPLTGVGLDGLAARGITSTDTSYLQMYAGTGAIGFTLLGGALLAALCTACGGGLHNKHEDAVLAAAVVGGIASAGIAAFSFDSLSGAFASWNLWLLAAMGVGLSELAAVRRERSRAPQVWKLSPLRLALPVGGLLVGLTVFGATPVHSAQQVRFFTLVPKYLERNGRTIHDDYVGRLIINATCESAESHIDDTVGFNCRDPFTDGPGTGLVRFESRHRSDVIDARNTFERIALDVHQNTEFKTVGAIKEGKPTPARVAPIVGAIAGAELALLVPAFRWRRGLRRRAD